jgi:hypothetical protein
VFLSLWVMCAGNRILARLGCPPIFEQYGGSMMCKTVVVHGPQGCGKTSNAESLAEYFGCSVVFDEWNGMDILPAGCLALTNTSPPWSSLCDAIVFSFDEAMRLLNAV